MAAEIDYVSRLLGLAEESGIVFLYHTLVKMHIKEAVTTNHAHSGLGANLSGVSFCW